MKIKKVASYTRTSVRKVKAKGGGMKAVVVRGHHNKLNRKPKKR